MFVCFYKKVPKIQLFSYANYPDDDDDNAKIRKFAMHLRCDEFNKQFE
jgi:hypothetical protein